MRISVFGLGYVGCISAACFAGIGHDVIGIDVNPEKVELFNAGKSPIVEPQLDSILDKVVSAGKLRATTDVGDAITNSDLSLICVGTPSDARGSIMTKYLVRVSEQIGAALKAKSGYHTVAYRSTMIPGTIEGELIPVLEKNSGKKAGVGFGICIVPEFLREASAVKDFYNPPFTLVGQFDDASGNAAAEIFSGVEAPLFKTDIKTAEMLKYANNTFHGLKICFANEIGNICKQLGIDSHRVMEIFCMDNQLNLGKYYLKPGFAFGGSCLTKDLRAILHVAHRHFQELPLLESVMKSNEHQIKRAFDIIERFRKKNIGMLGLSFKAETDDLRESPLVILAERLIGKGYKIKVFDESVMLSRLIGTNLEYIEREIPHIAELMTSDTDAILEHSEIIIVGNKSAKFLDIIQRATAKQTVVDLVRIIDSPDAIKAHYEGICW